jgi:hypothetical protein
VQYSVQPAPAPPGISVRWTMRVTGSRMDSLVDQSDGTTSRASWNIAYASAFWHDASTICGAARDTGFPWDGAGKGNIADLGGGYLAFGQTADAASDYYTLRRVP